MPQPLYPKAAAMADAIAQIFPLTADVRLAIASTHRELFVPTGFKHLAYRLEALPMAQNQWISSPLTVAKMTQLLECERDHKVLEVGCGSGYQAAVLSKLCRSVFTIERVKVLLDEAKERFAGQSLANIHTRHHDGQSGWREFAPYDRILLSASIATIPQALFDQLQSNGVLVAPINKGSKQYITKFRKNRTIIEERLDECLFVPVVDGVSK